MDTGSGRTNQNRDLHEASEHVAGAHGLLSSLRERLNREEQKHPELEDSIVRLEAALNLLAVQTGGTL